MLQAALKYHAIKHHSAETIKSDSKVKKHLKNETQEKLAQHIYKAHSKKKSNSLKTEPTICEKCGKTFANSNSRRLHVSRIHGNQDESPCPFCGKIFRSAYRLTRHINFTHSDKRYKCDECGVELKSKVLLNNHIIAFHKPEAHGCAECGKVFKSPSYLQGHIDYVHRGILKRYPCPNCVIVYSHRNKLNRHLLKCTKERPLYVRTSKTPGADNHFRTVVRWDDTAGPDADGKFPCPKCPKIFETAPKRSAHVRHTHLN
ncbi:putative zinc finger protein, partial [Orchesella cincta]